jgi:hypothetical protein
MHCKNAKAVSMDLCCQKQKQHLSITYTTDLLLFATVPESSINSCTSWFIFNLRNKRQLILQVNLLDAGIATDNQIPNIEQSES